MAKTEYRITNGRQIAVTRGRVLRDGSFAKSRKRVCVLDRQSSERFRYGYNEACSGPECRHRHMEREIVSQMVKTGILVWLGTGQNVAGYEYGRTWKGVPSGHARVKVMQLV